MYIHVTNMFRHGIYMYKLLRTWYIHGIWNVHWHMYLIISLYPACCVQDTILVIPPYPNCNEEDSNDVPLEDCWYACPQLLLACFLRPQGGRPPKNPSYRCCPDDLLYHLVFFSTFEELNFIPSIYQLYFLGR